LFQKRWTVQSRGRFDAFLGRMLSALIIKRSLPMRERWPS
jgi:hypothetical protein